MIDLPGFVVGCLATWRLTHLVLYENGPFVIFRRLREKLGVEYDDLGQVVSYRYELTVCIWCLSIWIGIAVTIGLWLAAWLVLWLLLPFGLSAVVCILSRVSGK